MSSSSTPDRQRRAQDDSDDSSTTSTAQCTTVVSSLDTATDRVSKLNANSSETQNYGQEEDSNPTRRKESHHNATRRKRVTFCPLVGVINIVHVKDYSCEEFEATWYTLEDMARIRRGMKRIINHLGEDGTNFLLDESSTTTIRGLEFRTRAGARKRQENKAIAREAVLKEQWRQWHYGIDDPELISSTYVSASRNHQTEAHERGLDDERVARALIAEEAESTDSRCKSYSTQLLEATTKSTENARKLAHQIATNIFHS